MLLKNDFIRKMIDFDPFTRIAQECGRFRQINCCQMLRKLPNVQKIAQSGHTACNLKEPTQVIDCR